MFQIIGKLFLQGLTDIRHHPWIQVLTLAAVTLVAFLAGLFLLVLYNLDQELQRSQGEIQFQVYWQPGTDQQVIQAQWETSLSALDHLVEMKTYTADQGLELLMQRLGASGDFSWLRGQSPLPATALLTFAVRDDDQQTWAKSTYLYLEALHGVEKVSFNPLQLDLARGWARFSSQVIWPLILFLGLVLALVVGNTIKLSQLHRRNEVEILRLVGASRWYIQLPMLVSGGLLGLAGGLLALLMLKGVQLSLKDLLHFPPLWLHLDYLPNDQTLLFLVVLVFMGILSSWVALREK
ncbi:cell division transport system permease protein [Desulfonatronum thiosulfatophilum]|uniref:Cell division protein FtsX n=1 Tax=Desulfonatronum thiosulfatophilum TaxID=617002 RepID=A0A1G6BBP4_9BACT|nr:FtsX-like permease family protein [Desulfonatronum thiosulfatophilum]SDB17979.1 cell division transport system permease protein [Desulfonatronum thiosulfatophilum]